MGYTFEGYHDQQAQAVEPQLQQSEIPKAQGGFVFEGYHKGKSQSSPTTGQQVGRGLGQAALRSMELPALAMYPIERALGRQNEGPINLPGREIELQRQHAILQREAQGQRPSFSELQELSDDSDIAPYPSRRTSSSVLQEMQAEIPKGGKTQERIARVGSALPMLAGGPAAFGAAALAEQSGLAAKQLAKQTGHGEGIQTVADIVGSAAPGLVQGLVKGGKKLAAEEVKMASGLTKPRAVEAKPNKFAKVTSDLQKQTVDNLEKEAAKLTKQSLEKHRPLVKQIEAGHDFESQFKDSFGRVKALSKKYNPEINTRPLMKFTSDARIQYAGIPNPHSEAKKIIAESRQFSKKPPVFLDDLMKIYRSNNQKVKNTYEKAFIGGKQKEYIDFLQNQNKEIVKSIKGTLPDDSKFVKMFEKSNKDFKEYMNTLSAKNDLKHMLGEKPSLHKLTELADNAQKQKQLAFHMGNEGANEVIQISKDLKKATNAVKGLSVKDIKSFEDVLPTGYFFADFIPVVGGAYKKYHTAKFIFNKGRSVYGRYLTKPETRRSYDEALKAFNSKNAQAFGIATNKIAKSLENLEEKE